jgi:hypothetical protein
MESSTVLAFRIFVMLSCLIIVPLAAIFGSAFPDVVKSVLVDRIVALSTGKPPEAAPPAASPEGFREVAPGSSTAAGERGETWEAPRWTNPQTETASRQAAGAGRPSGVVPVGGIGAREGYNQPAGFSAPADTHTVYPPVHRVPAAGGAQSPTASEPQRRVLAGASIAPNRAGEPPSPNPTANGMSQPGFAELERKLREAGATYYLLETWGGEVSSYRFHCRMAVGGDPNNTRPFEATDADALRAMSRVVEQVEAWRAGR